MNNSARDNIFNRLHAIPVDPDSVAPVPAGTPEAPKPTRAEKIERLKTLMGAVRTEVHVVKTTTWIEQLETIAKEKRLSRLLIAAETTYGKALQDAWSDSRADLPALTAYGENIEAFKEELFGTDAALTTTLGAIADPGAVILWPDEIEPRLMSLVPHVHIALVEADKIYASLPDALTELNWAERIPTNALLISGPSKTADIEFILTFGVHGPKELVLLIIDD